MRVLHFPLFWKVISLAAMTAATCAASLAQDQLAQPWGPAQADEAPADYNWAPLPTVELPILSKIPYLSRLFRNSAAGECVPSGAWMPVDAPCADCPADGDCVIGPRPPCNSPQAGAYLCESVQCFTCPATSACGEGGCPCPPVPPRPTAIHLPGPPPVAHPRDDLMNRLVEALVENATLKARQEMSGRLLEATMANARLEARLELAGERQEMVEALFEARMELVSEKQEMMESLYEAHMELAGNMAGMKVRETLLEQQQRELEATARLHEKMRLRIVELEKQLDAIRGAASAEVATQPSAAQAK